MNAIVVYYINASGELVTVPNCAYDAKNGTVTFTTTHFSTYAVGYNAVSFSDVTDNAWCADYVTYLASRGIVGGNNGAYSPDASITRAEFVTILARMSGDDLSDYRTSSFSDVSTDRWYFAAVQWVYKNGIASGYDGAFGPQREYHPRADGGYALQLCRVRGNWRVQCRGNVCPGILRLRQYFKLGL